MPRKVPTKKKPDQATAYHEAGHAIAADELDVLYGPISIRPNKHSCGRTMVEGGHGFNPRGADPQSPENEAGFRAWAKQQAVIEYAGHAAVVVLLGMGSMSDKSGTESGAGDDFKKARRHLGGDRERIKRAKARAVEIITARRDDVRKVVKALIKYGPELEPQDVDCVLIHGLPVREWTKRATNRAATGR